MYEIYHHGIKGQKWGVRRYQNDDGTLTSAWKVRNGKLKDKELIKKVQKKIEKDQKGFEKIFFSDSMRKLAAKHVVKNNMTIEEAKKAATVESIALTGLYLAGIYGTYKLLTNVNYGKKFKKEQNLDEIIWAMGPEIVHK